MSAPVVLRREAPIALDDLRQVENGRVPEHARVRVDGKFFACGSKRFEFRGVTYGTFRAREDGALFPATGTIARDLESMAEAGFTVVRTYTAPPDDLLELAARNGLRVFAGAFFEDWRYMLGGSRKERSRIARRGCETVRDLARRLAGNPTIAALAVGNEVPADVVRWVGAGEVGGILGALAETAHQEDPELLVTYANYPSTEYLSVSGLDFLTFNVFLERESDLRRYLSRLHNLAGERPLVLGELGLDAGQGDGLQAEALDWQLAMSFERGVAGTCVFSWTDEWWVGDKRVEGWHFGVTDAARCARPALDTCRRWNRRDIVDLKETWPSIAVVVCARNAEGTIDECLDHTCALDYPHLEVIVVDDGSTDNTATIAHEHSKVRVITTAPLGLANARNVGAEAARSEIVAYLDADAFPPPEWPYLMALGFDSANVGGVGGPNLPPRDDPLTAQAVARAPGGPVHVLLGDDRAEHIPGCNMAFWREVITELDGFDPIFTAAGDDVDFCWRALDASWDLGFHPAAFVWHRRRSSLRQYARQQVGYGRAEALVQSRHPDRFTAIGAARWRGRVYTSSSPSRYGGRVYRGVFGTAGYQSIYRSGGHLLDILHQVGVPVALLCVPAGLLVALATAQPAAAALSLAGLAFLAALTVINTLNVNVAGLRLRSALAACYLIQPVVRNWSRLREQVLSQRGQRGPPLPAARRIGGGALLFADEHGRAHFTYRLIQALRSRGFRLLAPSGWEDYDARLLASVLVTGDVVTSAHPDGCIQLRVRRHLRPARAVIAAACVAAGYALGVVAGSVLAAAVALDLVRGLLNAGPRVWAAFEIHDGERE